MIFGCPNCDTDCPIPDDRIKNRILKVRCKQCKHVFYVKDPKLDSEVPTTNTEVPPTPTEDEIWFYAMHQQTHGPVSNGAMRHLIESAQILSSTLVWKEGMSGWKPMSSVPELTYILQEIASPVPDSDEAPIAPGLDDMDSADDLALDFATDEADADEDLRVDLNQETDETIVKRLLEEEEKLQQEFKQKIEEKKKEKEEKKRLSKIPIEAQKDPEEVKIISQLMQEEERLEKEKKQKKKARRLSRQLPAAELTPEVEAEAKVVEAPEIPEKKSAADDSIVIEDLAEAVAKPAKISAEPEDSFEEIRKLQQEQSRKARMTIEAKRVEMDELDYMEATFPTGMAKQLEPKPKSRKPILIVISVIVIIIAVSVTYALSLKKVAKPPEFVELESNVNLFNPGEKLKEEKLPETPPELKKDTGEKIASIELPKDDKKPVNKNSKVSKKKSAAEIKAMREAILGTKKKKNKKVVAKKKRYGGAIELPPVPLDSNNSEPLLQDGLRQDQIKFVVNRKTPRIRVCYESQLRKNPNLTGKLMVNFIIENNGKVSSVKIKTRKFKGSHLEKCVIKAIKRWRFPRFAGDPVNVDYPFIFSAF